MLGLLVRWLAFTWGREIAAEPPTALFVPKC